MNYRKIYIQFIACFAGVLCSLPVLAGEENVFRQGRLDNGLSYYIRHTHLQPGLASFYLVQNVGSLMEEKNQNGLAHFLEHMAFNATETFPQQVDLFLQSHGITSYNAYTAPNETVYNLDDIPVKGNRMADSCLLVLRDWCHYLSLTETGIAKERGIIEEEWRRGRTVMARALDSVNKRLYNDTKYAYHNVIGDIEVVRHFKREELVAYYKDWYRPEFQAVIVVGDIDVQQVEDFVREKFSEIPATVQGKKRETYLIPDNREPLYFQMSDPGLDNVSIDMLQRIVRPALPDSREKQVERILIKQFFNQMLEKRFNRLSEQEESNVYEASAGYEELTRGYDYFSISVSPYPEKDFRALSEVMQAFEQVKRFGFTPYEFDLEKKRLLRQIAGFERNLDKLRNEVFVTLYRYHYLEGVPVIEPGERNRLMRDCLEKMTVADVNRWIHTWADSDINRSFIVLANEENYSCLGKEDILAAEEDVRDMELEPLAFQVDTVELIDFELIPGTVVKEKELPLGNAKEWTLSNGAKVVFKIADEGSGRVEFMARSEGGLSLVKAEDLPSAYALNNLAFRSGIYKFDQYRLQEIIQEHNQSLAISLQEWGELVQGSTPTSDIRQFMELIHLVYTHPQWGEPEYVRYVNELKLALETKSNPLNDVSDSIARLFQVESPRLWKFDSNYMQAVDMEKIKQVYSDRFENVSDFVFYIVGDIEEGEARELACRYIGSLPASRHKEKLVRHDLERRFGHLEKIYPVEMPGAKAIIELRFQNRMKFSRQDAVTFWMFGTILKSRCVREIREKRGGTYDVQVATSYTDIPFCAEKLTVSFETDRSKARELKEWVRQEIAQMAQGSVTQADVQSIASAQKRLLEKRPKDIRFWMDALYSYCENGLDKTRTGFHEEVLDAITPESMSKLMQKFLKKADVADIIIESVLSEKNK